MDQDDPEKRIADLERQLAELDGLESMKSDNSEGGTNILLRFNLSRNVDAAGADVQAAINNAAITAPINEVTLVSSAGNTLAVPSTITGGVGNFAVGWDASA